MVAEADGGEVVGYVVCTRGWVDGHPALGLGPLAVLPDVQGRGAGSALMHAVLGAADALEEPLVVLLGHTEYYPRFGFRPAAELGVDPPVDDWAPHFQVRTLGATRPDLSGVFRYAPAFDDSRSGYKEPVAESRSLRPLGGWDLVSRGRFEARHDGHVWTVDLDYFDFGEKLHLYRDGVEVEMQKSPAKFDLG